jgi:hypothetical protein
MRRVAVLALVAGSLLAVLSLLTACGSGARRPYSVADAKAAFAAQGVHLHPFRGVGDKPAGAKWVTLIGRWPHPIHVNVRLGRLTGIYKRVTNQMSAVGWDAKQFRNVLVVWRPRDQAVVRGALRRLK